MIASAPRPLACGARPAQALLLDAGPFRLASDVARVTRAMALAEGVTTRDQRHRLLVVHCHAGEGLADVVGGGNRVRLAVRAFGIDVDESHLDRAERFLQVTLAAVAGIAQPFGLRTPVDVFFRLPGIGAPAGEAVGLEAHRFQRTVAGKHHQVRPGQLAAVLLLDRPQQAACLVEVAVVRPAVQRCEPVRAGTRTATTVVDAVGSRAVPGHADEQGAVVSVVGRPPVLAVGHQGIEILADRLEVEAPELGRVVEPVAHGIHERRVLLQDLQVELVRPPDLVGDEAGRQGPAGTVHHGTTAGSVCGRSVHHSLRVIRSCASGTGRVRAMPGTGRGTRAGPDDTSNPRAASCPEDRPHDVSGACSCQSSRTPGRRPGPGAASM